MSQQWCYSFNDTDFSSGVFGSKEAALEEAKLEAIELNNEEGESKKRFIYLAKCKPAMNSHMFPDADIIIDHMTSQADDIGGVHSDDYPDVSKEQEEELTDKLHELLSKWCEKHNIQPSFYTVLESKKYDLETLQVVE